MGQQRQNQGRKSDLLATEIQMGTKIMNDPMTKAELERIKEMLDKQPLRLRRETDYKIYADYLELRVCLRNSVAEIERLKEELAKTKAFKDEEHAIVQKVWKALGKETYREAKPFTIWEWVEKDKETITHLQTKLAETRKDKERLDWLLNALMEQGQILNQLGWADGRQAIDTAMKATK